MLTFSDLKGTAWQKVKQGTSGYRIEYWLVPGVTLHIGAKHRVQIFFKHFTDATFHTRKNLLDKMRTFWNIWKFEYCLLNSQFTKLIVQSCLDMLIFLLSNLIVQNKWYVDIFCFLIWLYKIFYNTSRSDRMVLIFFLQVQCKMKVDFSKIPRPFVN